MKPKKYAKFLISLFTVLTLCAVLPAVTSAADWKVTDVFTPPGEAEKIPATNDEPASAVRNDAPKAEPGGGITVATADEFLAALGSDRTIILGPGVFNLSDLKSDLSDYSGELDGGGELIWDDVFDGAELRLVGVKNLTIRGTAEPEGPAETELQVDPRYSFVAVFENCENIQIEVLIAGHSEGGECEGGVFRFVGCEGVTLDYAAMYGCGTEGLNLENTRRVSVTDSRIYDCSYYIMTVSRCKDVSFKNCAFDGNGEFDLINVARSDGLSFEDCWFSDNRGERMFNVDNNSKNVTVKKTLFEGNEMGEPIVNGRNVSFTNCQFR
jgi:hypothetical protein